MFKQRIVYPTGYASTMNLGILWVMKRTPRFERTDIWREGQWLDLWSVVHFLSGASFGLGFYFLHLGAVASVVIVFLLLVAYEMWEVIVKIEETPTNRLMDVVVGMVSFLPTFLLLDPHLYIEQVMVVFGVVLFTNITLSILGWHASKKAAQFEARVRERYEKRLAKILARRARHRHKREGL